MTRALLEQALAVLLSSGARTGRDTEDEWLHVTAAIRAHLAKPDTAPAWHDAPTEPGLWVSSYNMVSIVTPDTLKEWLEVAPGAKWFGPIPDDKP